MTALPPQHRGVLRISPSPRPLPHLPHPHGGAGALTDPLQQSTAGSMDGVPAIINISISLRIQPNEGPVFFKVDGTRFGQSRTIKLLTGSKYKIEVVVKPGNVEAT